MAKAKRRLRDLKRAGSTQRDKVIKQGRMATVKIPDGIELFRPKDKTYRLDLLLKRKIALCSISEALYFKSTILAEIDDDPANIERKSKGSVLTNK